MRVIGRRDYRQLGYGARVGAARSWFREQGLVRPGQGRWLAGVCEGIGRRLGVPALVARAVFVISVFVPGPQFLAYIALWLLMPSEKSSAGV